MSLTETERANLVLEVEKLIKELEEIELNTRRTFRSVIIFAIIGIFFFPCLIVAGICYLLYRWGKERSNELKAQIETYSNRLETSSAA